MAIGANQAGDGLATIWLAIPDHDPARLDFDFL